MMDPSLKGVPMVDTSIWQSPLCGRYASREMQELFSDDHKFKTWRRLWVALAEAEYELGLNVTSEQIAELKAHMNDINYEVANAKEKEVRHDVMAHVYAYGQQCPKAAGIIHLGATSCFVTDNTDLLNIYDGLELVRGKLLGVIKLLAEFADEYAELPTLGYTHGQPAALTTVGKRATLWLQNFAENLDALEFVRCGMKMLGCRGATGSAETFMKLFDGDEKKVKRVEELVLKNLFAGSDDPITQVYDASGQTYPRHFDICVITLLAAIAASAYKMATDIRLLQHDKELEEPFEKSQIGSSAMPYKRNPMRSERICSLARHVEALVHDAYDTANVQWLERTLDDSANRRMSIPEAFLGVDAVLILCANVVDGLVVNRAVIEKRMMAELPFMATEEIMMKAVQRGGNRQELHERIRQHSMAAGYRVKQEGKENDLIQRIAEDEAFGLSWQEIVELVRSDKMTGRCAGQVRDYLQGTIYPLLLSYSGSVLVDTEVNV